jgi:hypothetical protein
MIQSEFAGDVWQGFRVVCADADRGQGTPVAVQQLLVSCCTAN